MVVFELWSNCYTLEISLANGIWTWITVTVWHLNFGVNCYCYGIKPFVKPLKSLHSIASSTFCIANFSSCSSISTKVENSLNTNKDNERNRIPYCPKTNSICFIAKIFIFFRYLPKLHPQEDTLAFKKWHRNCSSVICPLFEKWFWIAAYVSFAVDFSETI